MNNKHTRIYISFIQNWSEKSSGDLVVIQEYLLEMYRAKTQFINRRFPKITGEDNLTMFSHSWRVKSTEWRRQRRRALCDSFRYSGMDLLLFILDYQLGEPNIQCACSPRTVSAWSAFLMPSLPFVYGYSSSCPRAHCTPSKSVPTLHYTRRHGPIYTGPCP